MTQGSSIGGVGLRINASDAYGRTLANINLGTGHYIPDS
jgi:hypothetical protein